MNKVILIGRLIKDAELKTIGQDDRCVLNFTLAVRREYLKPEGEHDVDFIPVAYWHNSSQSLHQYLKKGRVVSVEGRLSIRSYETQEGVKKYITQVIADKINFLDSRKSEDVI